MFENWLVTNKSSQKTELSENGTASFQANNKHTAYVSLAPTSKLPTLYYTLVHPSNKLWSFLIFHSLVNLYQVSP
jgi:hypothetical protein